MDEKSRLERAELRLKVVAAFLGLLTAVATVLGVTVGLFAKETSTANQQVDASQRQLQVLESQNASLKKRVAELEAGTARPQQSNAASPSASASTADGPAVRHEGDLILVPGSGYDLTSTDPRWGQDKDCTHEINFEDGTPPQISTDGICSAHSIYTESLQLNSSDQGSYAKCRMSTGYQRASTLTTKAGVQYCIHSNWGYYALLTVTSVAAHRIDVHVLVWEKE